MKTSLGIDLGGTNIKAVWRDTEGRILRRESRETKDSAQSGWKQTIRDLVDVPVDEVGLAAPGLVAASGRGISFMPERLSGLENFDWNDFLPTPVRVLNDAHAALLGEVAQGAARGKEHVVLLTLGTGVGGAALCEGRLMRGAIGRAGHFGHMSLNPKGASDIVGTPGSLEDAFGDCTVERRTGFASTRDLVLAVQRGDTLASGYWQDAIQSLAASIVSLINAFDPQVVVLGGGITAAGPLLFDPVREFVGQMEWRPGGHAVPVMPAELGDWAGAVGAACYTCYEKKFRISGEV